MDRSMRGGAERPRKPIDDFQINRRWLFACLGILGGFTLGLILFIQVVRLREPLFMEAYMDVYPQFYGGETVETEYQFTLPYLDNADTEDWVVEVTIPELDERAYQVYVTDSRPQGGSYISSAMPPASSEVKTIGCFALHNTGVTILQRPGLDEEPAFNRLTAHYSSGRSVEVDIGEIRLKKWISGEGELLSFSGSSSTYADGRNVSTENYRSSVVGAFVQAAYSPGTPDPGLGRLTVNGVTVEKLPGTAFQNLLKAEGTLWYPTDIRRRFTRYAYSAECIYQDETGKNYTVQFTNLLNYSPPDPSFIEALQYIHARKGEAA